MSKGNFTRDSSPINPPSRNRPNALKYEGAAPEEENQLCQNMSPKVAQQSSSPVARAARQISWFSGVGGGTLRFVVGVAIPRMSLALL